MSKWTVVAVLVAVALVGCGPQKPAQAQKPAEPAFTATLETLEPMTVAYMEKTGPYAGVPEARTALAAWATGKNIQPGQTFAAYHNNPANVPAESLRWDVCMAVPAGTRKDDRAGVKVEDMPATSIATTVHVGPPTSVGATYGKLVQWIAGQNMNVAGPSLEFYGEQNVPRDSMRIKVAFPVVPQTPTDTTAGGPKPPPRVGR